MGGSAFSVCRTSASSVSNAALVAVASGAYCIKSVISMPIDACVARLRRNLYHSRAIKPSGVRKATRGGVMGTTYGAVSTPPQAAIVYMRSVVADSVLKGMYDIYQIQVCTSVMGTFSRRIGEAVLTQVFRIFPGIDTFVSICNVLSMGLVSVYGSLQAQIGLLYLVDGMMMPFFLPAGLVLRFLPPTREAGAFLISLAFGFQIIYPMTYLINAEIFKEIGAQPYSSPTAIIYSLCGPVKYGFWGYMLNPNTLPVSTANALFPGGAPFFLFLSRLVSESTLNFVSMSEFFPILQNVAGLSLLALFMPALSMMVTIAFINAMTKFLVAKV